MSVYINEKPEYFLNSVESMLNQTIPPDEIVIVKDGPLTNELENAVRILSERETVKFIQLKKNSGLGKALRIGLLQCRNEIIARMDTDDISHKERCEKQLRYFNKIPGLSVVGTSISEFIENPGNIVSFKRDPEDNQRIRKYMKTRNPFNHMTVMFKKSEVIKAGNYKPWDLNEDYYLWLRMLLKGSTFANIDEPLVNARINGDTFMRRGGWVYFKLQKKLFGYMMRHKIINRFEYIYNNSVRFVIRVLLPNKVRKLLYLKLLRRKR
jgi:glycosyltransferase involved in cell wall biosynthesis